MYGNKYSIQYIHSLSLSLSLSLSVSKLSPNIHSRMNTVPVHYLPDNVDVAEVWMKTGFPILEVGALHQHASL
jgi:hypothetical protein